MTQDLIERAQETRVERRRARMRRRVGAAGIVVVVAATVGAYVVTRGDGASQGDASGGQVARTEQRTTLIALTRTDDPSGRADQITLFATDPSGAHPFTLFIPAGTLAPIPGQKDIDELGQALAFGEPTLLELSVENVLGIRIDRSISLDDVSLGKMIDALGGIDVDVTERIYEVTDARTKELVFTPGRRRMDGAEAVIYMEYRDDGESDLDRFVRARKVWEGIDVAAAGRRAALLQSAREFDPAVITQDDAIAFAELMATFAASAVPSRGYEGLPVSAISGGGSGEVYQLDERRVDALVARRFEGSRASELAPSARPRIEVRNGVGTPGLGERVAARIVPAGMKVEVTGNATTFGNPQTRIIVYGDDETSLALGRRLRELLGAGGVEVAVRGQTVVDATILIGEDFRRRR